MNRVTAGAVFLFLFLAGMLLSWKMLAPWLSLACAVPWFYLSRRTTASLMRKLGRAMDPHEGSVDLASRESLSLSQFYEKFYPGSGLDRVLVDELLIHLAQELRIPVDKIRPRDRFSVELAPRKGDEWDSGYGILLYELKSMARRRRKTITQRIETVDDYLKKMADVY